MQGIECNSQWQCVLPNEAAGLESGMAGWHWQQHKSPNCSDLFQL